MRKRVLVTGGAGFIGSHLIDRLIANGHDVVCIDDLTGGSSDNIAHLRDEQRFTFIRHDICAPLPMDVDFGVDQIFNLASPASPVSYRSDPIKTAKTNLLGSLNMLELAQRHGARILQASTSEVYGDPAVHPQKESYWGNVNPIGPRSCYVEAKRCAETLFFDYWRVHGLEIKVARIFNVYGPRTRLDDGRVISNFIVQALTGRDLTLYGNGQQTRSFCYVDDLIDGLILFMGTRPSLTGPLNLGNPQEVTVRGLAEAIIAHTGSGSTIRHEPGIEEEPMRRRPDISEAERLLSWQPCVGLEEGLTRTIAYFNALLTRGEIATTA